MMFTLQSSTATAEAVPKAAAPIIVEANFKGLFETYFERLFAYSFTIVKENAEAKDIVQTAFLKLWEKRQDMELAMAARSYLFTTVYHASLNAVRNRQTRTAHHVQMMEPETVAPVDSATEREIRNRIQTAIDGLPPRCREIFCKCKLEGKRYAAIAAELDISIKTVEAQMGKALKILREELADLAMIWVIFIFL